MRTRFGLILNSITVSERISKITERTNPIPSIYPNPTRTTRSLRVAFAAVPTRIHFWLCHSKRDPAISPTIAPIIPFFISLFIFKTFLFSSTRHPRQILHYKSHRPRLPPHFAKCSDNYHPKPDLRPLKKSVVTSIPLAFHLLSFKYFMSCTVALHRP